MFPVSQSQRATEQALFAMEQFVTEFEIAASLPLSPEEVSEICRPYFIQIEPVFPRFLHIRENFRERLHARLNVLRSTFPDHILLHHLLYHPAIPVRRMAQEIGYLMSYWQRSNEICQRMINSMQELSDRLEPQLPPDSPRSTVSVASTVATVDTVPLEKSSE